MVEIAEFQCLRRVYDKWVSIIRAEAKEIMVYGRFSNFHFFSLDIISYNSYGARNRWATDGITVVSVAAGSLK